MEVAVLLAKRMAAASLAIATNFEKLLGVASRLTAAATSALNFAPQSSVYSKHSPTARERFPPKSIDFSASSLHSASRKTP